MLVKFKQCVSCFVGTDLFCVACRKWFCESHCRHCVQCEQPVCKECYLSDLCCLVRPWKEKTEHHLKNFYENKLFDGIRTAEIFGVMQNITDPDGIDFAKISCRKPSWITSTTRIGRLQQREMNSSLFAF